MPQVYKVYGKCSETLRIQQSFLFTFPFPLAMTCWSFLSALALAVVTEAAIGPSAQLTVSNVQLAPDGFKREYIQLPDVCVLYLICLQHRSCQRAVSCPLDHRQEGRHFQSECR